MRRLFWLEWTIDSTRLASIAAISRVNKMDLSALPSHSYKVNNMTLIHNTNSLRKVK